MAYEALAVSLALLAAQVEMPPSGPVINWHKDRGPMAGRIQEDGRRYVLTLYNLGIEQYEDGKLSGSRFEQWHLACNGTVFETHCSLERVTFTYVFSDQLPAIHVHKHHSSDGTLRVSPRWNLGQLDLVMTYGDDVEEQITVDLEYSGDTIYLRDLRGVVLHRSVSGATQTVEHKVVSFDTIRRVDVPLTGLKTDNERAWDLLIESLSQEDRETWSRVLRNPASRPDTEKVQACVDAKHRSSSRRGTPGRS